MLIHRVALDMVSGPRRRRRRCGAGGGDPYRSRRGVNFRATGGSGGRILKKRRRPNIGRIGREAVLAVEPEELLLRGGQPLPLDVAADNDAGGAVDEGDRCFVAPVSHGAGVL